MNDVDVNFKRFNWEIFYFLVKLKIKNERKYKMSKNLKVEICCVNKNSEMYKIPMEEIELEVGYLKDSMGNLHLGWEKSRAVVISCQTGAGKTTFCEDVLIADAIDKGKKIVFVSNRLSLNLAEKRRIIKNFEIDNFWNERGLKVQCDFGDNIVICTYQRLSKKLADPEFAKNVEYVVLDEVHYFLADSGFSTTASFLIKEIPKVFRNSKRVYISATIEEVLPFICKYECLAGSARYKIRYGWTPDFEKVLRIQEDEIRLKELNRSIFAPNLPTPILYKMRSNYNFLDLHFFDDEDYLIQKIQESKYKWLIFVASKEKGEELKGKISDAFFLDASMKDTNNDYFERLIDEEKFDNKVLISTSVFLNGNNLKDEKLKNVVIYQVDETSVKQGLGRKRISHGSGEKINLYLKIPTKQALNRRIIINEEFLEMADKADEDPAYLTKLLLSDVHNVDAVKGMLYSDKTGKLRFGTMCLEKLKNDVALYKNLKLLLEKNKVAYCRKIASYFEIDFKEEMLESGQSKEDEFADFAERAIAASPMGEDIYKKYVEEFNKLRRKFNLITSRDNFGANRPLMTPTTFSNRAKEFNLDFRVKKIKNSFEFFYEETDNVTG